MGHKKKQKQQNRSERKQEIELRRAAHRVAVVAGESPQAEDDGAAAEVLAVHRKQYLAKWTSTTRAIEQDGHYAWMSSFLTGRDRVLEIGTGTGASTLAIAKTARALVGIDENPLCVDETEELLRAAEVPVTRERRERAYRASPDSYGITYSRPQARLGDGVVLLEGDLVNDEHLIEWLRQSGPFDAIACWCIGTHGARQFNEAISTRARNEKEYRFLVQNRVYEVADEILRPGGILHVVDRCPIEITDAARTMMVQVHDEQVDRKSVV